MLFILTKFCFYIVNFFLASRFLSLYLEDKDWFVKGRRLLLVLLPGMIQTWIFYLENHILSTFTYLFFLFLLAVGCFRGKLYTRVFFALLLSVFFTLTEWIAGFAVAYVCGTEAVTLIENPPLILLSGFTDLVLKNIFLLYAGKVKNKENIFMYSRLLILSALIPVTSLAGLFLFCYRALTQTPPDYTGCYMIVLLLVLINLIHYLVVESHAKIYQESYNNKMLAKQYEYREEYYKNVEKYQAEIRTIRHNLKNQLIAVSAGSEHTDRQIALIVDELEDHRYKDFTRHAPINALLNKKLNQAESLNITCDFDIKVPQQMRFDDIDLGSFLGNLLDNAIQANEKCPDRRYIKLTLIYYNNALILKSENRMPAGITDLKSRKADPRQHGFGIKSIEAIVKKYNGDIAFQMEKEMFVTEATMWEKAAPQTDDRKKG